MRHYISGAGYEVVDGQRIDVSAGDFVCIPAGSRHETGNPHDEPLRFICWQQIPGTYLQTPTPVAPV